MIVRNLLILLVVGLILFTITRPSESPPVLEPCPDGICPVEPSPPKRTPRRPWGVIDGPVGSIKLGRELSPFSGSQVDIDFPDVLWMENIGSKIDGAGMCVNTSIEHSFAIWHGREDFKGFRDYWAKRERGGSWPQRVDEHLSKWAEKTGRPVDYINFEGKDLDLLELAVKTGRMPAITYGGYDGVRYPSRIAHMVNLVHLDQEKDEAAILDNNGSVELIWMDVKSFYDRWTSHGQGWAVIPILDRPPLPPTNHRVTTDRQPMWPDCKIDPGYEWHHVRDSWYSLFYFGTQVGAFDVYENKYQPIVGEGFGEVTTPPTVRPVLDGVVASKIKGPSYRINGVEVTKDDCRSSIISSAKLTDDRWKLDIVFIGSKDACDGAKSQLDGVDLSSFRVFDFRPTDWQVTGLGFLSGSPMVYIQKDGKVLHRQDGVEGLVTAIRKLDPKYDPKKDPDLRQWFTSIPQDYLVGGLIILLLAIIFWGKK